MLTLYSKIQREYLSPDKDSPMKSTVLIALRYSIDPVGAKCSF